MDTTCLIDSFRRDLVRAAEVGGDDARAAAERLLPALEPALRLTLMEALSQAAAEIGEALPGVAIEVRLVGREPILAVTRTPPPAGEAADGVEADEGEAVARITLRIPEALKARAEAKAARSGQSLNTWLVAAARAAADDTYAHGYGRHGRQRIQGWQR
jgi:hypothetical protein